MTAEALRQDAYLGGRLQLLQPGRGYRAGMDAVLLAASCAARPGQRILDIGCGVGTAALCLGARVAGLSLFGAEQLPDMAAIARQNAVLNGQALQVFEGDVTAPSAALKALSVEHVIMNPPYFDRAAGSPAPDPQREAAMGQRTDFAALIAAARKRLVPGGHLTLIHRADAIGTILNTLEVNAFGAITILPLTPRIGRDARLAVFRARKGARAPVRLRPSVILHDGPEHLRDGDDYAPAITAVLRHAAPMPGFE